jgi:hypothetical protein
MSAFLVLVPPCSAWRFPAALIGDVISVDTMDACECRVFIELAAITLRDVVRNLLVFRGPRNDTADVIPLWAIDADARCEHQAQHRHQDRIPSHIVLPSPSTVSPPIRFMLKAWHGIRQPSLYAGPRGSAGIWTSICRHIRKMARRCSTTSVDQYAAASPRAELRRIHGRYALILSTRAPKICLLSNA